MNLTYLNGEFIPLASAKISPFDRGFIFGDGVYEVIPVFGGRLFRLQHHLRRLEVSLAAIHLPNPHLPDEWNHIFTRLVADNGGGDMSLYLQVTRGIAPRDHGYPDETKPTVFAYAKKMDYPGPGILSTGVPAITTTDIRWERCDIKAIALLANVMLRQEALEQEAAEAILIRDGQVTEGAASNIFTVHNGQIHTPPRGPFILPGITRDLILELAAAHAIPCMEQAVTEAELFTADEVWMTSSTKEILPITLINNKPVGNGIPGPFYKKLYALYQGYKKDFRAGNAE